ncbi:MAG TPA: hypothetical protein VFW21_00020 [Mycobacterium sp.]|nr:hypothetical protein [Mycobacterium sp.]
MTVYPGMQIRQGNTLCTLGYVDPVARVAFSAGHCDTEGRVTDGANHTIGTTSVARDNTPDGAVVTTDQTIIDYEAISLAPDVQINTVLPAGRPLVVQPGRPLAPGQQICHYGAVTNETCGTVDRVFNGWFTMTNGVVSQKGDSGGPVYAIEGNRAVLMGLFNCTWGAFPAAVSWQAAGEQLRADAAAASSAAAAVSNVGPAAPQPANDASGGLPRSDTSAPAH